MVPYYDKHPNLCYKLLVIIIGYLDINVVPIPLQRLK